MEHSSANIEVTASDGVIRCLKRYVAREVFGILQQMERENALLKLA